LPQVVNISSSFGIPDEEKPDGKVSRVIMDSVMFSACPLAILFCCKWKTADANPAYELHFLEIPSKAHKEQKTMLQFTNRSMRHHIMQRLAMIQTTKRNKALH
jgi:hypothetical protein